MHYRIIYVCTHVCVCVTSVSQGITKRLHFKISHAVPRVTCMVCSKLHIDGVNLVFER